MLYKKKCEQHSKRLRIIRTQEWPNPLKHACLIHEFTRLYKILFTFVHKIKIKRKYQFKPNASKERLTNECALRSNCYKYALTHNFAFSFYSGGFLLLLIYVCMYISFFKFKVMLLKFSQYIFL